MHTKFWDFCENHPPFFVPTGSPSRGGDTAVYVFWHKPTGITLPFLFCSYVCFCLYSNCIPFHEFSRQHSDFSLCSSGLISAFMVLWILYLFMKVSLSPDVILCGWLGLKHQLSIYPNILHDCRKKKNFRKRWQKFLFKDIMILEATWPRSLCNWFIFDWTRMQPNGFQNKRLKTCKGWNLFLIFFIRLAFSHSQLARKCRSVLREQISQWQEISISVETSHVIGSLWGSNSTLFCAKVYSLNGTKY